MRLAVAATVLTLGGTALAAPVAQVAADIDGDGAQDTVELGADGIVRITGKLAGSVTVAPAAAKGTVRVAHLNGQPQLVIEVGGEGIVLVRGGSAWKVAARVPIGGMGLDADYAVELDATPAGIYRYQTRAGLRRCDGKPAYLFAEGFDGTRFGRVKRIPTGVPETAPAIAAKADGAAAAPQLFRARLASHQPGAGDAGGLGTPSELDDGKPDTLWREELSSAGEGQFFTFETGVAAAKAKELRVLPGPKPANRPKRLGVVSAQGAWHVDLPDAASDPAGTAYVAELPEAIAGCVTVVIESTYGPPNGQTALAELEVFAEGERAGGGDGMLAKVVADGGDGARSAAQSLARRGAAGAQAIDGELAKTTSPAVRRRLLEVLVKIADPAAAPSLLRAAQEKWVRDQDMIAVIDALAALGRGADLADLAGRASLELDARIAAVRHVGTGPQELPLLVDLAGKGARDLRRAVIERLATAPLDALLADAPAQSRATASGDLWKAVSRHARAVPADRAPALAALVAALPAATDYERRYRLVDGIAQLGDAAAIAAVQKLLAGLPAGAETSALRQVAIRAIGIAPRIEALPLVLGYATDPDPGVRLAVLTALAGATADPTSPWHQGTGPDGIDRVIVTALGADSWPEVRRRAATSLGARCQRPGPAAALAAALHGDKEPDVRRDALISLVACRAPGITELVAKTWDDGKQPVEVRTLAVDVAVELEDPQLGKTLVSKLTRWRGEAIESAEALALAQSAAAAIARMRAPGAAEALMAALDDSAFPEIVGAAADALGALGPACPPAAKQRLTALGASDDQSADRARRAAARCGR